MLFKTARETSKEESEVLIFACPTCEEVLYAQVPVKRSVTIQCAECLTKISVKKARALKTTVKDVLGDGLKHSEPAKEPDTCDDNIVRATSLAPSGKAALQRARMAREAKRAVDVAFKVQQPSAQTSPHEQVSEPELQRRKSSRYCGNTDNLHQLEVR